MRYDQFIVIDFDPETGRGHVRPTIGGQHFPLPQERIGFTASHVSEYFHDGVSYGLRIPEDETINQRVPEINTAVMGIIAFRLNNCVEATDDHGRPFLRNWLYSDQYWSVEMNRLPDTEEEGGLFGYYADDDYEAPPDRFWLSSEFIDGVSD